MVDWCLLRDYNCDGKPDIFTSHQNGIRVFTNTTQSGEGPSFDPEPVTLFATFDLIGSDPGDLPVICLGMDLPAIMDHDDDGDLDIITFTETASTLYRFEGQTPCGLDLECTNRCYGMLAEAAENNALFIGDDFECSFNVENPGMVVSDVSRTGLHAGGALTSLQLEPGGPKDLIISDVTYPEALAVVLEVALPPWTVPRTWTPHFRATCTATKPSIWRVFPRHSTSMWTKTGPRFVVFAQHAPRDQRRRECSLLPQHRNRGRARLAVHHEQLLARRHG